METADHYEDCRHTCEKEPDCKRWTYSSGRSKGDCYLKKYTNGTLRSCNECMTGFKSSNLVKCSEQGMFHQ